MAWSAFDLLTHDEFVLFQSLILAQTFSVLFARWAPDMIPMVLCLALCGWLSGINHTVFATIAKPGGLAICINAGDWGCLSAVNCGLERRDVTLKAICGPVGLTWAGSTLHILLKDEVTLCASARAMERVSAGITVTGHSTGGALVCHWALDLRSVVSLSEVTSLVDLNSIHAVLTVVSSGTSSASSCVTAYMDVFGCLTCVLKA